MKEKDLQSAVIEAMHRHGWYVAHFTEVPVKRGEHTVWMTPVQADGRGFPDIVAVRERVIFVELKIHPNKMSEKQAEWAVLITAADGEFHLWTDREWGDGTIENSLRFRRPSTV